MSTTDLAIQNKTLVYCGGLGEDLTTELIHAAFIPFVRTTRIHLTPPHLGRDN
jgi:hypothetical protein